MEVLFRNMLFLVFDIIFFLSLLDFCVRLLFRSAESLTLETYIFFSWFNFVEMWPNITW